MWMQVLKLMLCCGRLLQAVVHCLFVLKLLCVCVLHDLFEFDNVVATVLAGI